MMRVVLLGLACLCICESSAVMQIPMAYKSGGAMPNTCGSWKYGTQGVAGESVNPFCKSTDRDAGTTGLLHDMALPSQARAFDQTVSFKESNTKCSGADCTTESAYTMTTNYWNDRPCHSGEMFARCTSLPVAARSSVATCNQQFSMNYTTGQTTADPSGMFKKYTSPFPGAPACLLTCCATACPKTTCLVDTYDQCPESQTIACPQWPQCIVNKNCASKTAPTCTGVAGEIKGDSCAYQYPGCGAANKYSSLSYNGGNAVKVMSLLVTGTARDITMDTTQVSPTDRINKLCGAENNMFSYKAAGSATLLGSAAVFPDKTSRRRNTNDATPETDPAKWQCNAGHPTWCECSKVARITYADIFITISEASLLTQFNSECSTTCTGGAAAQLGGKITINCQGGNIEVLCPFLKRIGYNIPAPNQMYFQYYRPSEEENIMYMGAQSTTLSGALETDFHSEGVYSLQQVCAACSLATSSLLVTMLATIVGMFMAKH